MRIGNLTKFSYGTIFNDLERPLTQISRSRHYLTLDMVRGRGTVMKHWTYTHALLKDVISSDSN